MEVDYPVKVEEIGKIENLKTTFENLGIMSNDGCKTYSYTQQDLDNMGE